MKNQYLWPVLFVSLFVSCSETDSVDPLCVTSVLASADMEPYTDQEIGCELFLVMYQLDGSQYFVLNSHCADIILHVLDCDGNNLCQDDSKWCRNFLEDAKELGIVGIAVIS